MRLLSRGLYVLAALLVVLAWSTPLSLETYANSTQPTCAPNLGVLSWLLATSGIVTSLLGMVVGRAAFTGRARRASLLLGGVLLVAGIGRCAVVAVEVARNDEAYRAQSGGFPCDR